MVKARAIQEVLELCDRDDELCTRVAQHLADALKAGQPALAIVTEARSSSIRVRMQALGVRVADAIANGSFIVLDVRSTLTSFCDKGVPCRERLEENIGGVIDCLLARPGAHRVHVYSETLDLLWSSGDRHTALTLETLWTELARTRAIISIGAYIVPPEVQRSLRETEDLVALLGHDLRNPLGTLTMGASYIARIADDEKIVRAADRMIAGADRMSRMIDQLVDLMRTRASGMVELARSPVDLAELCKRVQVRLDTSGGAIALSVAGDAAGQWDDARVQQVVETLVDNALAHGGGRCAIAIDGRSAANVVITVRNSGTIDAEILPVLFEALRGLGKRPYTTGLGLGLYIAKQIVLAHGGTIEADSRPSEGTTLRIALPRC